MVRRVANKIRFLVDNKLIRHFRESYAPVQDLCLATVIGLFWALTPLVGIQMTLVMITWFLFRLFRLHFSLPIGVAWVWITNPLTMPIFYYAFYLTGILFFKLMGLDSQLIGYDYFKDALVQANALPIIDGLIYWSKFVFLELGWAMLIGSFVIGIPISLISYPITKMLVDKHRKKLAREKGLSFQKWAELYIRRSNKSQNQIIRESVSGDTCQGIQS